MSVRATGDLHSAKESNRYEDYSRAVFGFEESYDLWDGNQRALDGVKLAKLAYATSALEKGDFDLGASLLDHEISEHAELADRIDNAKRDREARHHRAQQLKRVVIAMAAVGFFAALVVSGVMYSLKATADAQRVLAEAAEGKAKVQADIAKAEAVKARTAEGEARDAEIEAKKQEAIAIAEAEKARAAEIVALAAETEATKQEDIAKTEAENARLAEIEAKNQRDNAEKETYLAQIGLAAAKIDENAFDSARKLLLDCKEDLRNWEWGRLMHVATQSQHEYSAGAPIDAVAFAPDGKHFITGGWNGTASVWNVDDGRKFDLPHHGLYVQAVAFSPIPNQNQVATGCNDKSAYLQIWDLATRKPLRTLHGHTDAITSISYSKDGKRLLTTSFDKTARIWNVDTGKQLQVLEGHSWWVWDAAFSPDESQVVTASQDGTAIVWTLADGTKQPPFTGHQGAVYSVAFSPDGKQIASGGYDKRVLLWKPNNLEDFDFQGLLAGEEIPPPKFDPLDGHTAAVRSVNFSPDGQLVLSAGHDNTVKVWDVKGASPPKTLRGHGSWVSACAFSPDGQTVLSGAYDSSVRLWDVEGYEERRVIRGPVLRGHVDAVLDASFSRDGHEIATASRDRT
ncbi:MAG: serine/threonine protein kinase, partial [Planctomycetota bacterium]